jgi:hypothetical protein
MTNRRDAQNRLKYARTLEFVLEHVEGVLGGRL